ncbi:MAG: ABC transporter ATP-binding protein/permease [Lachnospiraceae bacterium]|nr:ABC transporter ATP-binding protein/permease [Lachnospiraceae bacterium]MDE6184427.1 ABC transporter ATP-binding protein/permease [Lachnospiraceae bacterium]
MKSLLIYLKEYKKESVLGPLFKLLEASFELIVPLVVASMIDVGISGNDKNYIIKMCLIMAGLGVTGLISSVTAQFFAAKAAVGFATRLRHALFSHIQSLSFSNMDEQGTSTLITRMTSDINQIQSGVNMVLRLFLRSPFIVFGAMIMAFTVDIRAALIFVVVIPLLSVVVFGIILISIPLFSRVQNGLDQVLGITRENLTGVRVIRAFGKEEEETEKFDQQTDFLKRVQVLAAKVSALMNPLTYIIINGGLMVLIYTGALRVESGALTQGQVVALVNYMSQILIELVKLANLIITVTKAFACGNRVAGVFEIPAGMKHQGGDLKEGNEKGTVAFEHVSMRYHEGGEEALSDVTFYAGQGETIGVIGGTGSGKTTLVHLIPRFYEAEKGSIKIDGADIRDYDLTALRDKVGIVMQKAVLFKGSIRDNLLWGNEDASEEDLWSALEIAQAKEFVMQKDGGLDAPVEQEGRNLSGGQKQRLSIARALVKRPKILILDDSASALDYATDAKLRRALKEMPFEATVFVVSQRASSLMHADRIIVLDDGCVAGIGTHEQLLADCETYQEIYYSQFERPESQETGKESKRH